MRESTVDGVQPPLFSNRLYDRLKYVALVILPAFSALYFGLGEIWGLPKVTEVIGTVAVLDTVLGMILRSSNVRYKTNDARFDGQLDVVEDEGDTIVSLDIPGDPVEVLESKDEVLLKVNTDDIFEEALPVTVKPPRKQVPRKRV